MVDSREFQLLFIRLNLGQLDPNFIRASSPSLFFFIPHSHVRSRLLEISSNQRLQFQGTSIRHCVGRLNSRTIDLDSGIRWNRGKDRLALASSFAVHFYLEKVKIRIDGKNARWLKITDKVNKKHLP